MTTFYLCPHKQAAGIKKVQLEKNTFFLQPEGRDCEPYQGRRYKIFLEPEASIYACQQDAEIRWWQDEEDTNMFCFQVSASNASELCAQCTMPYVVWVGKIKFGALISFMDESGTALMKVERSLLPCPGETLDVYILRLKQNAAERVLSWIYRGSACVPTADRWDAIPVNLHVPENYSPLHLGKTWFATPHWTGGIIKGFHSDTSGEVRDEGLCPADMGAEGDETLKYFIEIHGVESEITASDFAAYGVGDFVLIRRIGLKYKEPFDDSYVLESNNIAGAIVPYRPAL